MRFFGWLTLFLSLPAWTISEITTRIHDIDYGRYSGEDIMIFLESGLVTKIRSEEKNKIKLLLEATSKNKWIHFKLDTDRYILSFTEDNSFPKDEVYTDSSQLEEKSTYIPTTVASMSVLRYYHRTARHTTKEETQCFNRAMVWTYEWWKRHSLKSNKILIFFTRSYIRRYDFEWWFHIAPYAHVMHEGRVVERVLDVKYSSGPRSFKEWTDIFMHRDPICPIITKYSEYADNPYIGDCYLMRTHMYTYQPADLQMYEAWGYKKTAFNLKEVRGAYKEAFDIDFKTLGKKYEIK